MNRIFRELHETKSSDFGARLRTRMETLPIKKGARAANRTSMWTCDNMGSTLSQLSRSSISCKKNQACDKHQQAFAWPHPCYRRSLFPCVMQDSCSTFRVYVFRFLMFQLYLRFSHNLQLSIMLWHHRT